MHCCCRCCCRSPASLQATRRRYDRPVLTASDDAEAWDHGGVGSPCAVSMAGGKWRLYYGGRQQKEGPWRGMGLALSSGEERFEQAPAQFRRRQPHS